MKQYDHIIPIIKYFVERKSWSDWRLEEGEIDFYDLTYIISGKATYIINKKTYQLVPGDLIYIRKGSLRQAYTDKAEPMHCFAFNFNYYSIEDKKENFLIKTKSKIGIDIELINLYNQFNRVWLEKDKTYVMECRGILMRILAKLIKMQDQKEKSYDLRIEKVKQFIINNYHNNLEIKELADIIDLNPVYLGTLFKEKTGYTINQYINMIRINKAEGLLVTGECNVTQATYYCGFNDPFYFSKVYKEFKGIPPSQVKNKVSS